MRGKGLIGRRNRHDEFLNGQGHVVRVLCNAGRLVGPCDEEPVDRQSGQDHSHPDRRFNRLGNHRQDGDRRRQDDVHDREEKVHLEV